MTIGQSQSLAGVMSMMHQAETFEDVFEHLEPKLCAYLECERVSIYVRGRADREIVAKFMSGSSGREIRVPINTNSVAGYVAMSHNSVLIADAYNDGELKAIDPKLSFNRSFDSKTGFRTKAILAVPIKFKDVFLGVLQGINCSRGEFSQEHLERANGLACTLAQKFRYELRGTRSPFDYLIMTKRLSAAVLKTIQQRAESEGASIPQLILKETGVTRAELGESFSRYYQVPFMEFDPHYTIPPELLHGINLKYLRDNRWVPIAGSVDDQVTVLVDDPTDPQKMMEIQHTLDAKSYVFHVGFADDILKFLGAGQDIGESSSNLQELVGKLQAESVEVVEDEFEDEPAEDEAVVIQLVNKIIIDSYKERASDIHIEPGKGKQNATVRIRVDGVCRASLSIPFSHVRAVVSRIKIISGLDISERRKPQDGKAVVKYKGQPLELRVATVPTVNGESIVMRILASSEPLPLEKLNFSERNLRELENIITVPHGVFLVVGPTGSGKTTTLHAILGHINTPDRKIWTAEDPVEITQPGLSQVQMKPEIGLTFATALRSFLRADPDVIMIGEMRDHETAHIGVEASLTGHFVFSTLHTNSAPETVTRLLDLELDPVSFSDALQGVLAQRLVRTLCNDCKEPYVLPKEECDLLARYYGEDLFSEVGAKVGETEVFKPKGCKKCGDIGYRGRTGIHELLVATPAIKTLIYKRATATEIKNQAIQDGMRTLMQDGIQKMIRGQTDFSQIRKVAAA